MRLCVCQILLGTLLIFACDSPINDKKHKDFDSFEIHYYDGWGGGIRLYVDTNQIYKCPYDFDTIYTGKLPDTLFALVESNVLKIKGDTSLKSQEKKCFDCSVTTVRIISHTNDTLIIRNMKYGYLKSLIQPLKTFKDTNKHQKIWSIFFDESPLIPTELPPLISPKTIKK